MAPSPQYQHQQPFASSSSSQQYSHQPHQSPAQLYQAATPRTTAPLNYQEQTSQSSASRPATGHQQQKPRTFSFHSHKSQDSGGHSQHKADLHETTAEKEAKRLHSKADPTLAMSEAEPAVVAAMKSETGRTSLRSMQHRDSWGQVISDPDLSNPTRNRSERPLDTIFGFAAAIDGGYHRQIRRSDTESLANWNRRSVYQPPPPGVTGQPRNRHESHYGGRPMSFRPSAAQYDQGEHHAPPRNSYYDGHGYPQDMNHAAGGHGQAPPRQRMSRVQTEPHYPVYGRQPQGYPTAHRDPSYETVASAAVSGNSEQAGYHTDPTSSENSSINRRSPAKRPEPVNDHGIGFSPTQTYQGPSFTVGSPSQNDGRGAGHPLPQPPSPDAQQQTSPMARKAAPTLLKRQPTQQSAAGTEKRKSWFARRFGKDS